MTTDQNSKPCNRTILIIEDDQDIRETLQNMLLAEGYEVLTATNGKEGIELLKSNSQPRLVLLDMAMPVMNGMEFLDILTNDTILAAIPVYIHSATANLVDINGARGLIRKPASYEAILRLVKSYCD